MNLLEHSDGIAFSVERLVRWLSKPHKPFATQTHEPKTKMAPWGSAMVLEAKVAIELADELADPLPGSPAVGVYRQAYSGIPLAVRFVGRDRLLWNSMVQGTQDLARFGPRVA